MKRLLALGLSLSLVLSFTACAGGKDAGNAANTENVVNTEVVENTEEVVDTEVVADDVAVMTYAEYAAAKQMNLFEDLGQYTDTTGIPKSDDDGLETETNVLTNDIHNKNMTAELPDEDNKLVRSKDDEFRKETENIN